MGIVIDSLCKNCKEKYDKNPDNFLIGDACEKCQDRIAGLIVINLF